LPAAENHGGRVWLNTRARVGKRGEFFAGGGGGGKEEPATVDFKKELAAKARGLFSIVKSEKNHGRWR